MKKRVEFTTVINGKEVKIETELELSESDLAQLWAQKQKEVEQGLFVSTENDKAKPTQEVEVNDFEYERYDDSDDSDDSPSEHTQNSKYTPYTSTQTNQNESSSYTAYSSLKSGKVNLPKSYHPKNENGYAAYHTFRVVVPHGFKADKE